MVADFSRGIQYKIFECTVFMLLKGYEEVAKRIEEYGKEEKDIG